MQGDQLYNKPAQGGGMGSFSSAVYLCWCCKSTQLSVRVMKPHLELARLLHDDLCAGLLQMLSGWLGILSEWMLSPFTHLPLKSNHSENPAEAGRTLPSRLVAVLV